MAAAARSIKAAEEFCETFGIPKAVEGYDKLAELQDVDVIYVGVINNHHLEVIPLQTEINYNPLFVSDTILDFKRL